MHNLDFLIKQVGNIIVTHNDLTLCAMHRNKLQHQKSAELSNYLLQQLNINRRHYSVSSFYYAPPEHSPVANIFGSAVNDSYCMLVKSVCYYMEGLLVRLKVGKGSTSVKVTVLCCKFSSTCVYLSCLVDWKINVCKEREEWKELDRVRKKEEWGMLKQIKVITVYLHRKKKGEDLS